MLRRFAISFFLILVCACARARTRPHYGGSLHVEIAGDPWQGPDGLARRLVLDGLTALDANGIVSPALAVEWQSDSNDHRWQFRLRQGVHFHDGSPLNATAVVMALNTVLHRELSVDRGAPPWKPMVIFTSDSPKLPNLPALLAGAMHI